MLRRPLVKDPVLIPCDIMSTQNSLFDWLAGLEFFGVKLGLSQTRMLFDELGSPDRQLKFIHLAGSNGKGSTGAMIEAGLRGAGYTTGFYSSPHLVTVNERFRLNGEVADDESVLTALAKVRAAGERMLAKGHKITYFEATTATAAVIFADRKVDFVVWETGMGGRLDATNLVTPLASLITSISLEHKEYLGDTLEKIAFEKAGIVKPGVPVFCGCNVPPEAMEVIRAKARECHSEVTQAAMPEDASIRFEDDQPFQTFCGGRLALRLPGRFQRANAALAMLVLENLSGRFHFDLNKSVKALKYTVWPARFQVFPHENLLFDGAHNPECAQELAAALREVYPGEKFDFIYGSFADKETDLFLKQLIPLAASFRFVKVESARKSRTPEELCQLLNGLAPEIPGSGTTLEAAMSQTMPHRQVLCGSLHLCGEALALREKVAYRSSRY